MSISVQTFPLKSIISLKLCQLISPNQTVDITPYPINITKTEIKIAEPCLCIKIPEQMGTISSVVLNSESTLELVVFSEIPINLWLELIEQCKLSVISLNTINNRNGLISYRFNVQCNNIMQARASLTSFSMQHAIEAAIIENAPSLSQPGILVMDMDSTTITIECIDEIAKLAGVGEQVAAVTELAMQGELDFAQSLHQRVATLKGASQNILAEVASNIPLMPGLEILIAILKQHHWKVTIASGGFTYFSEHLKNMLELDNAHANQLEIIDGKLSGKILGDVVDAEGKANFLIKLSNEYKIPYLQTVAMGDGANDLIMMNAASLGVAFHAKDIVKKQADTAIHFSGLDCLLHWLN